MDIKSISMSVNADGGVDVQAQGSEEELLALFVAGLLSITRALDLNFAEVCSKIYGTGLVYERIMEVRTKAMEDVEEMLMLKAVKKALGDTIV